MGETKVISPKEMKTGSLIFHFGSVKRDCTGCKLQKKADTGNKTEVTNVERMS